ncbi:uncharacterized protein LY89DRAFT_265976 [Mollisia scopiformis]|uniref:Uncharacterized protein n=1 Tax=Mollisia scopiformis TaxID=149040 RepID=A0A132BBY4_MOLSC|nr:uncharacterized protein LY89DRAFT_265976 [Mollisia scopiformis]KUJ09906.1 hypothetical protein LY89DRAFT_265976 [Mollisia scopiformis]
MKTPGPFQEYKMDAEQIESIQSHLLVGMFCSAVLSTLQPDMKFSSVQFYDDLYKLLAIWNCFGTAYLVIRLVAYFRGRREAWWYVPKVIVETILWILPVFFVGFEGGLLAKKHILGTAGVLSVGGIGGGK